MKTRFDYLGLSTDDKPTEKAVNGSTFKEVDTSKFYIFYNGEWYYKLKKNQPSEEKTGENITINNTIKFKFINPPIPRGNTTQDGTPSPSSEIEVETVTGDVEINITNEDNTKSKTYSLTLGNIELCKIGNYQDYIFKENNKWYIHKEIEKYIFDETEDWKNFASVSGSSNTISQVFLQTAMGARTGFSDLFPVIADYSATEHIVIAGSLAGIYIQIANSRLETVDLAGFKNWLSENNVTFYGIPATTTTDTEITDTTLISQLKAIEQATSYDGQTNISGTSDGANPFFEVEVYQNFS